MTDGMTTDATTVSDFEDDDNDDNNDNDDNDDNDEDDIPGPVESESKEKRKLRLNVRNGQTLQELPGIE